ncbi:ankyrin [Aspergillus niger ATCC 13496]|uniref:Ankyrin n=1 Tax=Aspergillus niger ATCC 13496 TaxID=1353008 RepID=A0A370C2R2_ASPNG|nr:ankyrin [Aspergillus niger ATCC 13496]
MTTALTRAARLKPEVRLGQAISEFQADCSSREKATLRSYQAAGIPPSIRDVMQLTAEVNRSAGLQGRCFGSRLTNILQAVQEFAALGDIVLGGSQSLLACGIWALVRMSLLPLMGSQSIVKYSAYFEQLSAMLMAVGRSAPRYQLMGVVYPKSQRLRTSMLEYFITVVQLCHHVIKLSRKTAFGQWASTMTTPLKGYQSDLELWAAAIKEEVNLLMVQQLSLEAEDNSWFRSQVTKRFESQSYARRLKARQRVLDACSTYYYEQDWKRIRKLGTTSILETSAVYANWKAQQSPQGLQSRTLSVILANMVDDLNLEVERKAVVAYFFCQHDSTQSLAPKTVIGSLARQLLQSENDLDVARDFLGDKRSLEVDEILSLLKHLLPTQFEAVFILDGLMHCDAEARQNLIKLSLCVSELRQLSNQQFLPIEDNKSDIDDFINAELERCLESGKLVVNDPALVLEIRDSLSQGAQGMFLWAALQMEALCLERTDADMREAIASLPRDLSALYTMILKRSRLSDVTYQSKILDLVAIACRPLTTEEMREALSVVPWETTWDPARRLNDIHATLGCCGSLLTVDEESSSIRVVHHSVKTFIFDHTGLRDSHQTLAEIILTYLNYDVFSRQFSVTAAVVNSTLLRLKKSKDTDVGYSLLQYLQASRAMAWWQEHIWCLDLDLPNIHKLLINLLEAHDYDKPDFNGWTPLSHASQRGCLALVNWLLARGARHTVDVSGYSPLSWAINGRHLAVIDTLLKSEAVDPSVVDRSGETPLMSVIIMRDLEVLNCFCDRGARIDWNQTGSNGYTPLMTATLINFVEAILSPDGDTALHLAARKGYAEAFNFILVQAMVKQTFSKPLLVTNRNGETPLWLAAAHGHLEIVRSIFQYQDFDLDVPDTGGETPFWVAASNGHTEIVRYLANSGRVNVNHLNKAGLSALWAAVFNGHEDVVQAMIIMKTLDPNHSESGAGTPLEAAIRLGNERTELAAEEGYEEIVAILRTADCGHRVDLNFPRMYGSTALWAAASNGHVEVVQILISTGQVDLNRKSQSGTTPLWAAADNGHIEVVNVLASTDGVDVDSASNGYYHIVQALVDTGRVAINNNGHDDVVKFLIDVAVELNCTDIVSHPHAKQTPLWIASCNGHTEVVEMLVACAGVELDRRNEEGGHESVVAILASIRGVKLSQLARQYGHEDVVNVLEARRPRISVGLTPELV